MTRKSQTDTVRENERQRAAETGRRYYRSSIPCPDGHTVRDLNGDCVECIVNEWEYRRSKRVIG
jgi:hypothetical protein